VPGRRSVSRWPTGTRLHALHKDQRVILFRALSRASSAAVFSYLPLDQQDALLRDLTDEETRHVLATLPPDDRTHLLEELPGVATQRLLNLLHPEDLKEARWLLGYPEESVGRLMTPDYVAVHPGWSIGESLVSYFRATEVILVVSATMIIIVLRGSLIGMSLPFVLTRFGRDPATASAPLVTSLADISGVLIYFSIARWYLGL
jgi:Mg/Co/Ni transporter MgtE